MSNQNVKKMALHYSQCPAGDLHTGELMNLVCVDAVCSRRGLICPICRMNNHEEHQILPLKIFLDQVKKLFLDSEDSQTLNNLSDYLRSLESSHKELIGALKNAADGVAEEFRQLEKKVHENYLAVRRNVLAQSSISTKLPHFIDTLSRGGDKNAFELQEEFQKYSQLIKFQNAKMVISDKAKKIVEDFSAIPKNINKSLTDQVNQLKESFKQLFTGKVKDPQNTASKQNNSIYTFHPENKSFEFNIGEDNLSVSAPLQVGNMGLAYTKGDEGQMNKKIQFQIVKSSSGQITLGVGIAEEDKDIAFIFNNPVANRHFFAKCSGYNTDANMDEDQSVQEPDSFNFDSNGEIVTVCMNGDKNELVFEKKGSELKRIVSLSPLSEEQKKKLQFFVVLAEGDEVKIINS